MSNEIYDPAGRHTSRLPGSRKPDPDLCCVAVWGEWQHNQCARKGRYEHEGRMYCKQHHPDTVAAKKAASDAKLTAYARRLDYRTANEKWRAEAISLLETIANGHNDPRSVASEFMARKPIPPKTEDK